MNGFSRLWNYTLRKVTERRSIGDVHFCSQFVKNRPANPRETCRLLCFKMSNIEHFSALDSCMMWW
jgi:hypothetical protein